MAEQSGPDDRDAARPSARLHERINSVLSGLALLTSVASLYVAWSANNLKSESLSFSRRPVSNECNFEYKKIGGRGVVYACWPFTLSNRSENRVSIVYAVVKADEFPSLYPEFPELETRSGEPEKFPIVLDSGEAKRLYVRAPEYVPDDIRDLIERVISTIPEDRRRSSFDVQQRMLDFNSDPEVDAHMNLGFKHWTLTFVTGRGNAFETAKKAGER
jgi:hypothetical protein